MLHGGSESNNSSAADLLRFKDHKMPETQEDWIWVLGGILLNSWPELSVICYDHIPAEN